MSTRALHIHVTGPVGASGDDDTQATIGGTIAITISDDDPITDTFSELIALKTLGVYKTTVQMNAAIVDAVKAFLSSSRGIPTNGYAVTYVSGAYGSLI